MNEQITDLEITEHFCNKTLNCGIYKAKFKGEYKVFALKFCPFCGGEAVLESMQVRKGYEANIQCNGGCLASIHTITYDTETEAIKQVIEAWNRRAQHEKADKG